jgi:hypothetical protein
VYVANLGSNDVPVSFLPLSGHETPDRLLFLPPEASSSSTVIKVRNSGLARPTHVRIGVLQFAFWRARHALRRRHGFVGRHVVPESAARIKVIRSRLIVLYRLFALSCRRAFAQSGQPNDSKRCPSGPNLRGLFPWKRHGQAFRLNPGYSAAPAAINLLVSTSASVSA